MVFGAFVFTTTVPKAIGTTTTGGIGRRGLRCSSGVGIPISLLLPETDPQSGRFQSSSLTDETNSGPRNSDIGSK